MQSKKFQTVCIAGKNEIATYALSLFLKVYKNTDLKVVCNSTDTGHDAWQPSLRAKATANKVQIVTLDKVYNINKLLFLSLEYSELVNPHKFKDATLLNIHFSKLPAYKGMYTSVHPILNGEKESGVTLHKIDAGIDTGDIIDQIIFPINEDDNSKDLYLKYLKYAKKLFKLNHFKILSNEYKTSKQSSKDSSYYSKKSINYSDLKINLRATAEQIQRQIRAYCFDVYQLPCIADSYIDKAEILPEKSTSKTGTILISNKLFIVIATIDYNVKLWLNIDYSLFKAAQKGDLRKVKILLKEGAKPSYKNTEGFTALHVAKQKGFQHVVKCLYT